MPSEYVKSTTKSPFCWQHKPNLRYIRKCVKNGHIKRTQARSCIDVYRAITEFTSDQTNGQAEFVAEGFARRLAGYAMMSPDTVFKALHTLKDLGVIRYEIVRDNRQRVTSTFVELINLEEVNSQTTSESNEAELGVCSSSSCQPFPESEKPESEKPESEKPTSEVELDVEVEVGVEEDVNPNGGSAPPDNKKSSSKSWKPRYPHLADLPKLNARDYEYPREFEAFWNEYPRKKEKSAAYKKWRVPVTQGVPPEHILNGARGFSRECQGKDAQYIKLPATWLNQRCWTDYIDEEGNPLAEGDEVDSALEDKKRDFVEMYRRYQSLKDANPEMAEDIRTRAKELGTELFAQGVNTRELIEGETNG